MESHKYFTRDEEFNWVEVDEQVADDVIKQYFERRYFGAVIISSFLIGFLLGVIAHAL